MLGDMIEDDYYHVVPKDSVLAVMEKPKKPGIIPVSPVVFMNGRTVRILTDGEVWTSPASLTGMS